METPATTAPLGSETWPVRPARLPWHQPRVGNPQAKLTSNKARKPTWPAERRSFIGPPTMDSRHGLSMIRILESVHYCSQLSASGLLATYRRRDLARYSPMFRFVLHEREMHL